MSKNSIRYLVSGIYSQFKRVYIAGTKQRFLVKPGAANLKRRICGVNDVTDAEFHFANASNALMCLANVFGKILTNEYPVSPSPEKLTGSCACYYVSEETIVTKTVI